MLLDVLIVLAMAVGLTQVAVISTSIYFHRTLAHASLTLHPVADITFRGILWILTGQKKHEWVAVHRKHHAFTDKIGDPHSPQLLGFGKVWLLNFYYYMCEARNSETLRKFASDIKEDRFDRVFFSRTLIGPWVIGLGSLVLIFGWGRGIAIALTHLILYVFVAAPLINALGHWHGSQTFKNTAYNSRILAWVTGGESLHNNHHAHPKNSKFSMGPGEFDTSWPVVRGLERLGLAQT